MALHDFTLTRRAALLGAAALPACGRGRPPGAVTALEGALNDIAAGLIEVSPETASRLGVGVDQAGPDFAAELDDRSPLGEEMKRTAVLRWTTQIAGQPRVKADGALEVSAAAISARLAQARACGEIPFGRLDPFGAWRPYALSPGLAALDALPDILSRWTRVADATGAQALYARFAAAPKGLRDDLAKARADLAFGIVAPAFALDRLSLRLAGGSETWLAIVIDRLKPLFEHKAHGATARLAAQAAERVARGDLQRALAESAAGLAQLRGRAAAEPGLGFVHRDPTAYAAALAYHAGRAVDIDDAARRANQTIQEFTQRLDMGLRALGLVDGPPAARLQALALTPVDATSPIERARDRSRQAIEALPRSFSGVFEPWPELRAVSGAAPPALYRAPALDGAWPPAFFVAGDAPFAAPAGDMAVLVAQTYFGRHAPLLLARTRGELPLARRLMACAGAHEGFALYGEDLGEEAGLYEDAPAARIAHAGRRLLSAARLAADIGMHAQNWTFARCVAYLASTCGLTPAAATAATEEIALQPGLAAAAEIGRRDLHRLREGARTARGARFDVRAFHDLICRQGDAPLSLLASLADAWARA